MAIRRILAVTHECTLTGAPMNLLHFVTWVSQQTDVERDALMRADNELYGADGLPR